MTDDDNKPVGYDSLVEAMATIIEAERAKQLVERRVDREKLCLPFTGAPAKTPTRC
jgi:hypothetical protein